MNKKENKNRYCGKPGCGAYIGPLTDDNKDDVVYCSECGHVTKPIVR